jgi:hypothetical protein
MQPMILMMQTKMMTTIQRSIATTMTTSTSSLVYTTMMTAWQWTRLVMPLSQIRKKAMKTAVRYTAKRLI